MKLQDIYRVFFSDTHKNTLKYKKSKNSFGDVVGHQFGGLTKVTPQELQLFSRHNFPAPAFCSADSPEYPVFPEFVDMIPHTVCAQSNFFGNFPL